MIETAQVEPAGSSGPRPKRIVAILGMHRSGTSCLAGSLQEAGLSLGECETWSKDNPNGNRENQRIVELHDSLLRANRGGWCNPPESNAWGAEHELAVSRILERHAFHDAWGFKDPRTILFIDGWRHLVPDLERVGIFRHPAEVARSLAVRSFVPQTFEQGLSLWSHYNTRLLRELKRNRFPLLCFDWPEDLLADRLDSLCRFMGLEPPQGSKRFFEPGLRHRNSLSEHTLPGAVRELYALLEEAAFRLP